MSSSNNSNSYECHDIVISKYRRNKKPVRKERKYQLIDALINNDFNKFKKLLNAPRWYKVTDKDGNNLLHISILKNKREIFKYLLSVRNFPLEARNKERQTALLVALTGYMNDDPDNSEIGEYFAVELIKKGVRLPSMALHYAATRNAVTAARLLLNKGFNPNTKNRHGSTAFHAILDSFTAGCEFETLLLSYGVDPLIEDSNGYTGLELALHHPGKSDFLESLCFYAFDENSQLKIHLSVLLTLAQTKSPHFHRIVNQISEVALDQLAVLDYYMLFFIDAEYLSILVEKCAFLIIYVLMASVKIEHYIPFAINVKENSMKDLYPLITNKLNCNMIDFVTSLNGNTFFGSLTQTRIKESTIIELVFYLFSFGLTFNELDLQMVFTQYGYCNLFKLLLHMDFEIGVKNRYAFGISVIPIQKSILPIFIYDIKMDIDVYLEDPARYSIKDVDQLLCYFNHPRLKTFCLSMVDDKASNKAESMPEMPILVQLARDVFRKHLIQKFNITSTQQFYSYISSLPINNCYKKIITYEKKLY